MKTTLLTGTNFFPRSCDPMVRCPFRWTRVKKGSGDEIARELARPAAGFQDFHVRNLDALTENGLLSKASLYLRTEIPLFRFRVAIKLSNWRVDIGTSLA